MLQTGKPVSEGQPFRRRLLSEYITEYTLDNYIQYDDLKKLVKEAESLRLECEAHMQKCLQSAFKTVENSPLTPGCSVEHSLVTEGLAEAAFARHPCRDRLSPKLGRDTPLTRGTTSPRSPSVLSVTSTSATKEFFKNDPVLADLRARRERAQESFFHELEQSYRKVKAFLIGLEQQMMLRMVELHKLTERTLREEMSPDYIPRIYLQLACVLKYRELNLLALRKILLKFLHRVACDRLDLQRRVRAVDALITRSNVALPTLDLRAAALTLIAVYATVARLSSAAAVAGLHRYVRRTGAVAPRILPGPPAPLARAIPHRELPGGFAVRVLAGARSRSTAKMLAALVRGGGGGGLEGPACAAYPNGEIRVQLPSAVRGDDVFVVQSLAAGGGRSHADAVMELLLLLQTARLAAAAHVTAVVPYLAYARNVASIAGLAEMLEVAGAQHLVTVDMASAQVEGMFGVPLANLAPAAVFVRYLAEELRGEGHGMGNLTVVAPDGRHVARAKDFADALMAYAGLDGERQFVAVCTAVPSGGGRRRAGEASAPTAPSAPAHATRRMAEALRRQERGRRGLVRPEPEDPARRIRLVGPVKDRFCIILETELNEAVETANLARCLEENGAQRICVIATHAVLAGGYRERVLAAPIERIIVTDTIPQDDILRDPALAEKFRVLPIAPLLAEAIEMIHTETNLSALFQK